MEDSTAVLNRDEQILRLFKNGMSRKDIAANAGLSYGRVCQIIKTKTQTTNDEPQLEEEVLDPATLPASKKFQTPLGPCVVVARSLEERVALAKATKPEDIEGYTEALRMAQAANA